MCEHRFECPDPGDELQKLVWCDCSRHVRFFFFSSRRRHTRLQGDWSSDVCSSDLTSDGKRLWVSNEDTAEASLVDVTAGQVVRKAPVGKEPEGVAIHPGGKVV